MFASTILPAILAMAGGSLAAASMSVFETLETPQDGWYEDRDSSSFAKRDSQIELKIQLVHQNMDTFYERANNVCHTPLSPHFRVFPAAQLPGSTIPVALAKKWVATLTNQMWI